MTRTSTLSKAAIVLALLGTTITAASANPWQDNHPRLAVEVNSRLALQNFRINLGVATGTITPAQAQAMHAEDHAIRLEEKMMATFNGSHLTQGEADALNQQENAVSKQIGP